MRDYNWIGYLIPLAILVFSLISRTGKAVQRRIDAVAPPDAAEPRPVVDLRRRMLQQRTATTAPQQPAVAPAPAPRIQRFTPAPPAPPAAAFAALGFPAASAPMATAGPERPLLRAVFADPDHARRAVILAEILGPPVALRTTSPTRTAF
jgi:hypothetical protein